MVTHILGRYRCTILLRTPCLPILRWKNIGDGLTTLPGPLYFYFTPIHRYYIPIPWVRIRTLFSFNCPQMLKTRVKCLIWCYQKKTNNNFIDIENFQNKKTTSNFLFYQKWLKNTTTKKSTRSTTTEKNLTEAYTIYIKRSVTLALYRVLLDFFQFVVKL